MPLARLHDELRRASSSLHEGDALGERRLRLNDFAHHGSDHHVGNEHFARQQFARQRRRRVRLEPALDGRALKRVAIAREDLRSGREGLWE